MKDLSKIVVLILASVSTVLAAEPAPVFEDGFHGKLGAGWSWLREHPGYWRLAPGALEIRVEPGRGGDVKNALVREAPDRSKGRYAIEVTVTNTVPATNQFEQAGITWYVAGKPAVKIVKELVNGQPCLILGGPKAAPGKQGGPRKAVVPEKTARLRLVVSADEFVGQYQVDAKGAFQSLGTGPLPPANNDQVSIQCYNGAADAEHWFRFEDFKILPVGK